MVVIIRNKINSKLLIKTGVVVIALTILNFLLDLVLYLPSNLPYYGWQAVSNLLVFVLLGYYIIYSDLSGFRLTISVFVIYYFIGYLNLIVEAIIFNLADIMEVLYSAPRGLILAIIISPAIVYLYGKWNVQKEKIEFKSLHVLDWIWRVAVGDILYIIFYLVAGLSLINVYPDLMKFYNEKLPPPPELIFGTQLIRGLVFVGIAILVSMTLNLSSHKKAVLTGLLFSILGGIAPLMLPNAEMPAYIRLGHGIEVGISNFLYGLILGYLFNRKIKDQKIMTAHTVSHIKNTEN